MHPPRPVVHTAPGAGAHKGERPGLRLLDEEAFRAILISERKRTDRSNRPLGLLLVSIDGALPVDSSATWATVIRAVAAAVRGTDALGWFEWGRTMGAVFSEIRTSGAMQSQALEARVRRGLDQSLPPDAVRLSVRLHRHPPPPREKAGCQPIDLLLFPELRSPAARPNDEGIKRAFDVVASAMLLILLAPLFLLIAASVKIGSRGPVLLGQRRIGRMMRPFTLLRFRTMGPFLRRTKLDNLPQLWNVLRGEMSLVGPRPPLPSEVEQYRPWHCRRVLEAKPGITGLWQVAGRESNTLDEMVRLDLRYARTRSLWSDVRILLTTPAALFSGRGAWAQGR